MDNPTSHKVKNALTPILDAGASVLFLPPYSPDLNPIEMMWSKIKVYLRMVKARSKEFLEVAISLALDCISSSDILAWFSVDGYGTH